MKYSHPSGVRETVALTPLGGATWKVRLALTPPPLPGLDNHLRVADSRSAAGPPSAFAAAVASAVAASREEQRPWLAFRRSFASLPEALGSVPGWQLLPLTAKPALTNTRWSFSPIAVSTPPEGGGLR